MNVRRSTFVCERIEDSDMEEGSVNSKKKEQSGDRRSRMKKILPTLDFNFDRQGTTLLSFSFESRSHTSVPYF